MQREIIAMKCRVMTTEPRIRTQAPMGLKHRISPQSAWPLRNSDGLTFAEAKRLREREESK